MTITDETYTLESLTLWVQSQMGEPPAREDKSPKAEQTRKFRRTTQTRLGALSTLERVLKPREKADVRKIIAKHGWLLQRLNNDSATKKLSPVTIRTTVTNAIGTIRAYLRWIEEDPELRDGSFDCNKLDKGLKAPLAEIGLYKKKLEEATREAEAEAKKREDERRAREEARQRKKLEEIEAERATREEPQPQEVAPAPLRLIPGRRPASQAPAEEGVVELLQGITERLALLQHKLGPQLEQLAHMDALIARNRELESAFELLRGLDVGSTAPRPTEEQQDSRVRH